MSLASNAGLKYLIKASFQICVRLLLGEEKPEIKLYGSN